MNAQELLQIINNSCFLQLGDVNFNLTERIKKELTKEVGDFEIVSEKYYKGKGEWKSIVIHLKKHNIYLNERRLYSPKFPKGSCVDYQGSEFWEVKPKGKSFAEMEELF